MEQTGLIPVFSHADVETVKNVLDSAYEAGIRVFEFTNRTENAVEVFTELARYKQKYPDMILGTGTVFDEETAIRFYKAGAQFLVSPACIPEIAHLANKKNILYIPGCGTVTEVFEALKMGVSLIKIFPANVLGPAFAKAVKSVLPQVKIMPTGGVLPNAENLQLWFSSGVSCVGMGSQLFDKNLVQNGNYEMLTHSIQYTLQIVKTIRS